MSYYSVAERLVVAVAISVLTTACSPSIDVGPASDLLAPTPSLLPAVGEIVSYDLATGESVTFAVSLEVGEVLSVRAQQISVDLTITFSHREGSPSLGASVLAFSDSNGGVSGPEWLAFRAETTDDYWLTIEAIGGNGSFELMLENLGLPSHSDLALHRATEALHPVGTISVSEHIYLLESLFEYDKILLPELVQARIQYELGRVYRELGRFSQASTQFQAALDGFRLHGNTLEQVSTLNHLGLLQIWSGQLDDAKYYLETALALGVNLGVSVARASTWNNLGILHATQGRHTDALDAYRQAEKSLKGLPISSALADCRHNLAMELLALGRTDAGIQVLDEVAGLQQGLDDRLGEGRAWAALGWGYERRAQLSGSPGSDHRSALKTYEMAIQRFQEEQATWDLTVVLERRGSVFYQQGQLRLAQLDLERSMAMAEAEGNLLQMAWVQMGLSMISRDEGRIDRARQEFASTLQQFDGLDYPSGQVATRLELARLERKAGNRDRAAEILNEALTLIERSRSDLRTPEFRRTFLATRQDTYAELVDLWAEAAWKASRSESAMQSDAASIYGKKGFSALERGKARALLDWLGDNPRQSDGSRSEDVRRVLEALEARYILSGNFLEESVPNSKDVKTAEHSNISFVQARTALHRAQESASRPPWTQANPLEADAVLPLLGEHSTLLAYALGDSRSWLFVLQKGEIRVERLAPRQKVEDLARRTHELLPLSNSSGFRQAAEVALPELASLIVAPLRDDLLTGRLVVIPDGALHLVPFGLLPDSTGQPLLSNRKVVHLPSASSLARLRQRSRKRPLAPKLLALVADPVFSPFDPRLGSAETSLTQTRKEIHESLYLPRLSATKQEAEQIGSLAQELFSEDEIRLFDSFTADRRLLLDQHLVDYRILHLATHGLVDANDPALAGLFFALFDPRGRWKDGFLPARDLYDIQLNAELVVLSACRTADGQRIRGEGIVGLSHGFFAAGARHLVVSLWEVDDRATAELMTRFYSHLLNRKGDPANALRLAQLELRDETAWSSPRYWAGFLSFGDWQVNLGL